MIEQGNWWHTTMNLEPRHEKPPLPTWLTAFAALAYGGMDNLFILRLPSALIGSLMVLFFYAFSLQFTKRPRLSLIAGGVMATNFMMISLSRINTWDIYTHAFMIGSIWLYLKAIETQRKKFLFYAVFMFALSFMSKGPVSLYTVFLPFILVYYLVGKQTQLKKEWKPLGMLLLFGLLIGAAWYISMYFTDNQVAETVIGKELQSWGNRHPRPFYFYFHFPVFTGVWAIPLIAFFFHSYARKRLNNNEHYFQILLWIVLTLVLLSVIPSKKERYLLPMMIPTSLATAYMLNAWYELLKSNKALKVDKLLFYAVPVLVAIAGISLSTFLLFPGLNELHILEILTLLLVILLSIAGIVFIVKNKAYLSFIISMLIIGLFTFGFYAKMQMAFEGNPELISLSKVNDKIDLYKRDIYVLEKDLDPRMVWLIGKNILPVENISLDDPSNFPLVYITFSPIESHFTADQLRRYEIEFFGKYDIRPRASEWKAHVYELSYVIDKKNEMADQ